MNEIALIILQILFIIFIFNFSIYEVTKKIKIKYFNLFDSMSVNIILLLNILLFLSLINITLNYLFLIVLLCTIFSFIKNFNTKIYDIIKNKIFIISLLILSFIISIDLASTIDLGWDAKIFGFFKTLNFYQQNDVQNLKNLNVRDYPHLGGLLWALYWKFPFNYNEYFGRISYILIYLVSIFTFYFDLKLNKLHKIILIFLTIFLSYEYSLVSGLQEILVFSLILIATKFVYLIFHEKNLNNQNNLIFYILLITNAVCWIKNEGLILMLIFNFSLFLIDIRKNIKIRLAIGSLLIIAVRALYLFNQEINFESSEFENTFSLTGLSLVEIFNDLKIMIFYMGVYCLEIPIYLFFIPMIIWLFFYKNKNNDIFRFIILFGIINFLFLIFAFLFNMTDVEWAARVSLKRVMFESAGFYLLPLLLIINPNKK
ncbi:hypothetical protein N9500_04520 [Candidatus Pelagibacter sp.]|jgi:hypothetical protein|nr:hypothetical protein [Candidatus Pelagibacter sp.]